MAKLVNVDPSERPSCDRVMKMLAEVVKEVKLGWSDEDSEDRGLVQTSRSTTWSEMSPSSNGTTTLQIFATQVSIACKVTTSALKLIDCELNSIDLFYRERPLLHLEVALQLQWQSLTWQQQSESVDLAISSSFVHRSLNEKPSPD